MKEKEWKKEQKIPLLPVEFPEDSVYQVEVTVQPEQETMAPESGQNVPPGDQLAGNATAKPQVDASEEEMRIEKQRMQYIVGIMAAFCGLLILGIISLIRRYRSQNLK